MKRAAFAVVSAFGVLLAGATTSRAEDLVRIGLAVPNNAIYAPFYAADALGLSRAHLARTLQELRERRCAAVEANTLVIYDRAALAEHCAYEGDGGDEGLVII